MEAGHFASKMDKEDPEVLSQQMQKAVFVDEISCIGCKNCANAAPGVFRMEKVHHHHHNTHAHTHTDTERERDTHTCFPFTNG